MTDVVFPTVDGIRWSALVQDADTGEVLLSEQPDLVLSTASIGKLFLLHRLLVDVDEGLRSLDEVVTRRPDEMVGASGLWKLMQAESLSVYDLGLLVGAVSDNAATNTLCRVVGIKRVREHSRALGYEHTALNDKVRWPIPPGYPERLSQGNATELVRFVRELADGVGLSSESRDVFLRWLGTGSDTSMVAQPFNFDPPDHFFFDRGAWLWNKTGTLLSVRSDVGMYMSPERRIAYAVTAQWNRGADPRDEVLAAMADIGTLIKQSL
ncbi:MAG: serine hydrolase [Agrococcus casei]|uniref:serine hydrolase n=1 Tax=Agrococcus casei TaxID=343512 RepID=UPI003F8ED2EA